MGSLDPDPRGDARIGNVGIRKRGSIPTGGRGLLPPQLRRRAAAGLRCEEHAGGIGISASTIQRRNDTSSTCIRCCRLVTGSSSWWTYAASRRTPAGRGGPVRARVDALAHRGEGWGRGEAWKPIGTLVPAYWSGGLRSRGGSRPVKIQITVVEPSPGVYAATALGCDPRSILGSLLLDRPATSRLY